MPPSLDRVLQFTDLIHRFRGIERTLFATGSERNENDAEHSFSLALLAWFVNTTYNLGLDTDKLLKYALAHDLVEVYAGDTYFYTTDTAARANKDERERLAMQKLKEEYADFPELHEIIARYEKREDAESRFVYALDKVEPVLNIYQDGGRSWKRAHVTLDMLQTMKSPKVALDPTIEKLFGELVSRLTDEQERLFA